jgi:hypothetical protein
MITSRYVDKSARRLLSLGSGHSQTARLNITVLAMEIFDAEGV